MVSGRTTRCLCGARPLRCCSSFTLLQSCNLESPLDDAVAGISSADPVRGVCASLAGAPWLLLSAEEPPLLRRRSPLVIFSRDSVEARNCSMPWRGAHPVVQGHHSRNEVKVTMHVEQ